MTFFFCIILIGEPLEWTEGKLRAEDDYSVDMDVSHCGICGSDIHTMDSDWGAAKYPVCVGHELAGVCTRVGKKVTNVKVGDRIGVGTQSGSCHECKGKKKLLEKIKRTFLFIISLNYSL